VSTSALLVLAHLGHWYVQLAFAGPALVIIGFLARDSLRRRLRERRAGEPSGASALARHQHEPVDDDPGREHESQHR
jgi:hypothetical protein